jgi:hypothetical protein
VCPIVLRVLDCKRLAAKTVNVRDLFDGELC